MIPELSEEDALALLSAIQWSRRLNRMFECINVDPVIAGAAMIAASLSIEQMFKDPETQNSDGAVRLARLKEHLVRKSDEFSALYDSGGLDAVRAAAAAERGES